MHDGGDHIVVGGAEGTDSLVSGARSVVHDHIDVRCGQTLLVLGFLVGGLSGGGGLLGSLGHSGLSSHDLLSLLVLEFLGFGGGHALVGILNLELAETAV